jgi:hypothetical protein
LAFQRAYQQDLPRHVRGYLEHALDHALLIEDLIIARLQSDLGPVRQFNILQLERRVSEILAG